MACWTRGAAIVLGPEIATTEVTARIRLMPAGSD